MASSFFTVLFTELVYEDQPLLYGFQAVGLVAEIVPVRPYLFARPSFSFIEKYPPWRLAKGARVHRSRQLIPAGFGLSEQDYR
jgi:hypothetical protein